MKSPGLFLLLCIVLLAAVSNPHQGKLNVSVHPKGAQQGAEDAFRTRKNVVKNARPTPTPTQNRLDVR